MPRPTIDCATMADLDDEAPLEFDPVVIRRTEPPPWRGERFICRLCERERERTAWHRPRPGQSGRMICTSCVETGNHVSGLRKTARADRDLLQTLSATIRHLDWEIYNGARRRHFPRG